MPDFHCDAIECRYCANLACRVCDDRPIMTPIKCPHDLVERHVGMAAVADRPSAEQLVANRRITERMPQLVVSDKTVSVRVTLADPESVASAFEMLAKVIRAVSSAEVDVVVSVTAVPTVTAEPVKPPT